MSDVPGYQKFFAELKRRRVGCTPVTGVSKFQFAWVLLSEGNQLTPSFEWAVSAHDDGEATGVQLTHCDEIFVRIVR